MLSHCLKNTSDSPYFSRFPLWALKSQGLPSSECLPSGLPASTFVPPIASSEFRNQGQSFKTNPVPTDSPIPLPTFPGVFLPRRTWVRSLPMVRPFLFSLSPKIYLHIPLPQSHLSFHILSPTPLSSSHAGLRAIADVFLAYCHLLVLTCNTSLLGIHVAGFCVFPHLWSNVIFLIEICPTSLKLVPISSSVFFSIPHLLFLSKTLSLS